MIQAGKVGSEVRLDPHLHCRIRYVRHREPFDET